MDSNRKALSDLTNEVAARNGGGVKKLPQVQSKRVYDHNGGIDFKVRARIAQSLPAFLPGVIFLSEPKTKVLSFLPSRAADRYEPNRKALSDLPDKVAEASRCNLLTEKFP